MEGGGRGHGACRDDRDHRGNVPTSSPLLFDIGYFHPEIGALLIEAKGSQLCNAL